MKYYDNQGVPHDRITQAWISNMVENRLRKKSEGVPGEYVVVGAEIKINNGEKICVDYKQNEITLKNKTGRVIETHQIDEISNSPINVLISTNRDNVHSSDYANVFNTFVSGIHYKDLSEIPKTDMGLNISCELAVILDKALHTNPIYIVNGGPVSIQDLIRPTIERFLNAQHVLEKGTGSQDQQQG